MIPKIIHHTGPTNPEKWHPIWKDCRESWKNQFPNFEFILWNDEDIRSLVEREYNEFLELYDTFPYNIMRVDFSRFCILHSYGGIYADLDIYCYKNFYDLLKEDIYIVESWEDWGEIVQNSLMISTKNNKFWMKCIEFSQSNFLKLNKNILGLNDYILETCGPKLISRILDTSVNFLPKELFNPQLENQFNWGRNNEITYHNALKDYIYQKENEKNVFTRHYLTGNWNS